MISWFQKLLGDKQPTSAIYEGKEVTVYSITESYAIISYTDDAKGMFSVDPKELKNLK